MGNWDAYSNHNSVLNESKIFRVDVGGALNYRARNNRNNIFITDKPIDHEIFNSRGFIELMQHIKNKNATEINLLVEANKNILKNSLRKLQAYICKYKGTKMPQRPKIPSPPASYLLGVTEVPKNTVILPAINSNPLIPQSDPFNIIQKMDDDIKPFYNKFFLNLLEALQKRIEFYYIKFNLKDYIDKYSITNSYNSNNNSSGGGAVTQINPDPINKQPPEIIIDESPILNDSESIFSKFLSLSAPTLKKGGLRK